MQDLLSGFEGACPWQRSLEGSVGRPGAAGSWSSPSKSFSGLRAAAQARRPAERRAGIEQRPNGHPLPLVGLTIEDHEVLQWFRHDHRYVQRFVSLANQ